MNLKLDEIIKTSGDIWQKGWCESNGGNMSVRLDPKDWKDVKPEPDIWWPLPKDFPNLAGNYFLISASGKYLRNIEKFPEKNLGVIKINPTGTHYAKLWGFLNDAVPTSELSAHLSIHDVRTLDKNSEDKVVIHAHPKNLITLTYNDYITALDSKTLSKLIWKMHAEGIVVFPDGIGYLPWMMAGSNELANSSCELFNRHRIIVWERHGVVAVGRNLDSAFGLIDAAEKITEIYLTCLSTNGFFEPKGLSNWQLKQIAKNFNVKPIYKL